MTDSKRYFLMIPPFEISGKKQLVVASRGHFEISKNRIEYIRANNLTNLLKVYPKDGVGEISQIPSFGEIDTFKIISILMKEIADLCFFEKQRGNILLEFLLGNLLPFSMKGSDSGFYELKPLPDNIYEEFYRMTMTLEDTITTTISTFDENVFIPFKQRFVSTVHNRANQDSKAVLSSLSRDFPKFFGLHRDLLLVLRTQAKQVSNNQQLSFRFFSPILRKIRILDKLFESLEINRRWGRTYIKNKPIVIESEILAQKLTPIVAPK
ncbi:MAG: hypothetical protein ACXACU_06690 [Candidatus Hodarchaeales archaeon]